MMETKSSNYIYIYIRTKIKTQSFYQGLKTFNSKKIEIKPNNWQKLMKLDSLSVYTTRKTVITNGQNPCYRQLTVGNRRLPKTYQWPRPVSTCFVGKIYRRLI